MRIFCGSGPMPVYPAGMRVMKNDREPNVRMRFWM